MVDVFDSELDRPVLSLGRLAHALFWNGLPVGPYLGTFQLKWAF